MYCDKIGSPPCGIYVRVERYADSQALKLALRQMAMVINRASGYEKNLCAVEFAYQTAFAPLIKELISLVQEQGLVAIISGPCPAPEELGADGVLLTQEENITAMREKLGETAIIGLTCGESKIQAQAALTANVDYVVLSAVPNMIGWWVAQTDKPCVVSGQNITDESCGSLAFLGAGFVDVSAYLFNHKKGIMQATVNMLHALELATQRAESVN